MENEGAFRSSKPRTWDKEPNEKNIDELKRELFDEFSTCFEQVPNVAPDDEMILLFQLASSGLWRIEASTFGRGGAIEWIVPYRLRHLISGKYLAAH